MKINYINKEYLVLITDLEIYSLELLHKCFYWYSGSYDITIEKKNRDAQITISCKGFKESVVDEKLVSRIQKDLIDFKTREIVNQETKTIRELIIAKAFSNSNDYVHIAPGEWTDPVSDKIDK